MCLIIFVLNLRYKFHRMFMYNYTYKHIAGIYNDIYTIVYLVYNTGTRV